MAFTFRITKVDHYIIYLPLIEPFIISYTAYESMPAIIAKVHTDAGIVDYEEYLPNVQMPDAPELELR